MRRLTGFAGLAAEMERAILAHRVQVYEHTRIAAEVVRDEIRATYGSKRKLLALADATVIRRLASKRSRNIQGADAPLLDTGSLRDSVRIVARGYTAHVGTDDKRALWHELGSSKYPPRPVFRIATDAAGAVFHSVMFRAVVATWRV